MADDSEVIIDLRARLQLAERRIDRLIEVVDRMASQNEVASLQIGQRPAMTGKESEATDGR